MSATNEGSALLYSTIGVLILLGLGLALLIPFTTPAVPHRAAGILFGLGFDGRSSIAALASADPGAQILDIRWRGRLIYVLYDNPNAPTELRRAGALYVFDAIAAGCHGASLK